MDQVVPVRVGILEAGTLSPDMNSRHGSFASWFQRFLPDDYIYDVFNAYDGSLPEVVDTCDAYIITGSAACVLDVDPWITALSEFAVRASEHQPVLGVCFGHQLLHQVFGGRVEKSPKGWGIGVHEYAIGNPAPWMAPALASVSLCVSHSDQVVELAPNATRHGGSRFCPNAITTIGPNIMTFQGHPEYTKEFAADLYASRRDRIGSVQVDAALESLGRSVDRNVVSQWVTTFLDRR